MSMWLEQMTKEERSLLLYLEARAVDHFGLVDTIHMNAGDMAIAEAWNTKGFVVFGRVAAAIMPQGSRDSRPTHYVELSNEAWELAHLERRARYARNDNWRARTLRTKEV